MSFIKSAIKKIKSAALTAQILLVVAAFGLLVLSSYTFVDHVEQARMSDQVDNALELTRARIEADLDRAAAITSGFAMTVRSMITRGDNLSMIMKYFEDITDYTKKSGMPGFRQYIGYFEGYGNKIFYGEGMLPDTVRAEERPWYAASVEAGGRAVFTEPYVTVVTGETIITCALRIHDDGGKPLGVFGINLGLESINASIGKLKPFAGSYGFLAGGNGVVIVHPDRGLIGKKISGIVSGGAAELEEELRRTGGLNNFKAVNSAGVDVILNYKGLEKYGWGLGVMIPERAYMEHSRGIVWFFLIINALVLAVLCYVLLRLSRAKRRGDEFTRLVFDGVPLACQLWNSDREMVMCNDAVARLFGLRTKQEYMERFHGFSPEYQPCGGFSKSKTSEMIEKAFAEGSCRFEWMHKTADGKPLPCEVTLIRVAYRNQPGVMAYTRDMREEKAVLEKLREAEEHIQSIYNAAPFSITTWNSAGSLIDCNQETIRLFEVGDKKELLSSFIKLMPDYQADGKKSVVTITRTLAKTFKEGQCRLTWDHRTAKGDPLPLDVFFVRLKHKDGHIAVAYARDMRELNAAMAQLREADERSSIMLNKIPVGVTMWDSGMNIIDCNREAMRVVGMTDEDKDEYRKKFWELLPERQPNGMKSAEIMELGIKRVLETGVPSPGRPWFHYSLSGELIEFEAMSVRTKYRGGYAAIIFTRDMREFKAMVRETQRAEIAEASSKAKSRFLAAMSHEIRTPMNVILGVTDIQLQDETLPPHLREAFTQIYNSSDLLLGIINDILDLSKIEAGRMEFTPAKYSLASLINDAAHLNMMRNSKPIGFELDISENAPVHLYGDELRIKQILNNLLSNAFKFTEQGMVKLRVVVKDEKRGGDGNDATLEMTVVDTGQGMTREQVGRLFAEYTRFNLDANRTVEGTGLGMNITRRLIGMMGGNITVDSEPDVGTTVTVSLPQKRVGGETIGRELADNLRKFRVNASVNLKRTQIQRDYMPYGRVLIVDDVESNLYVARGLMAAYGLSIDTASSGLHAIEKIKAGKTYDIIFMDHMMPKMDGIETTRRLREAGYTLPIVALTANAVVGQADIFLSSGFDDFISKPIDIRQLNSILNRFVRDKQTPEVIARANQASERAAKAAQPPARPACDPELLSVFARDAAKTLYILETVAADTESATDEELALYAINAHAMKSALANIGEAGLSKVANTLENSGKEHDRATIAQQTPNFIKALKGLIDKAEAECKLKECAADDEDPEFLRSRLLVISKACWEYDERAADAALSALKKMSWTAGTEEVLQNLSDLLLHSSFEEAAEAAALAAKRNGDGF